MKVSHFAGLTGLVFVVLFIGSACVAEKESPSWVPDNYADWASTVADTLDYDIPGHEWELRIIHMNEIGQSVVPLEENGRLRYEYPEGTVIVKENFAKSTDQAPTQLTLIKKESDHPDSLGGWLWVSKSMDTGAERLFSDEFCFTCHKNANERHPYGDQNRSLEFRDYVFYPWRGSGT